MPSITVRVTAGPRWCAELNRWQHNGEEITITAADDAELLAKWANYEVHCRELVSGEIPTAPGQAKPKVQLDESRDRILAALREKREADHAVGPDREKVFFKVGAPEEKPKPPKMRTKKSDVRVART